MNYEVILRLCRPRPKANSAAAVMSAPGRFAHSEAGRPAGYAIESDGGALFARGALAGKVGSVFTSTNFQHGHQESRILHYGMIIVGLPHTFAG